mgnify:CR=1 FL=1
MKKTLLATSALAAGLIEAARARLEVGREARWIASASTKGGRVAFQVDRPPVPSGSSFITFSRR